MPFKTWSPAMLVVLALVTQGCDSDRRVGEAKLEVRALIEGEFELQPYQLPNDQGYRHMTSFIDEKKKELILFGGLGDGTPSFPTPMNHHVYSLNLTKPPFMQTWIDEGADSVVDRPWFTSTRGWIELDGRHYLTCDDTDNNAIYEFDVDTRTFSELATPDPDVLDETINAGDCCAVGAKVPEDGGDDLRIYIVGGRNDFLSPVPYVRYYSLTHREWKQVAELNAGRSHHGCVTVERDGSPLIYAMGGNNSTAGTVLSSVEVYDPTTDHWARHDNLLDPPRTRLAVQNIENEYLLLIGGDLHCVGGCPGNDLPLTTVDLIDIADGNRFVSGAGGVLPQLQVPRQTPATSIWEKTGNNAHDKYTLYVIAGRTRAREQPDGTDVATSTEVLSFDRIGPKKE